jgi:hypothetical protein
MLEKSRGDFSLPAKQSSRQRALMTLSQRWSAGLK